MLRRKMMIEHPESVGEDLPKAGGKGASNGPKEACRDSISLYAAMNDVLFQK
jgi:hypothetical protein